MAPLGERQGKKFILLGNYLWLDFINTLIARDGQPVDFLSRFDDLIGWLGQTRVLDAEQSKAIIRNWSEDREAEKVLERAREFRAGLRHMAEKIVKGKAVPQTAVDQINELLQYQAGHGALRRVKGGFEKQFQSEFREPIHLLWPVAESACDLLAYGDLSLIKKCENVACVLFFYDTTKNHSRRWCRMSACGNRMKVAAHYRRLRTSDTT
jgi:predicted RNA-binding Zn ribbon-like protein